MKSSLVIKERTCGGHSFAAHRLHYPVASQLSVWSANCA